MCCLRQLFTRRQQCAEIFCLQTCLEQNCFSLRDKKLILQVKDIWRPLLQLDMLPLIWLGSFSQVMIYKTLSLLLNALQWPESDEYLQTVSTSSWLDHDLLVEYLRASKLPDFVLCSNNWHLWLQISVDSPVTHSSPCRASWVQYLGRRRYIHTWYLSFFLHEPNFLRMKSKHLKGQLWPRVCHVLCL